MDVKRFFDEHVKEMEEHRVAEGRGFTYFGHANRAYRTPEDVLNAAEKSGCGRAGYFILWLIGSKQRTAN